MLSIICALAENRAIGYKNDLLYHLREDLKRFKALTTGHTIIMGRNTYVSLPKGALPNRRNIVLSASICENWSQERIATEMPNTEFFPSLEAALAACDNDAEVFVIGGARVYQSAFTLADRLYLTHVHATPEAADVFFPEFDEKAWECTFREDHEADDKNEQPFTFADYIRR